MTQIEQHPIGANVEKHKAVFERIFSHNPAVIDVRLVLQKETARRTIFGNYAGAGTAILWRQRKIVLTAKHNLPDATPNDLGFIVRPDTKIEWGGVVPTSKLSKRVTLAVDTIERSDEHDLAAILLAKNSSTPQYLEFFEIAGRFGEPPIGGGVAMIGYPVDRKVPLLQKRAVDGSVDVAIAAMPELWTGEVTAPRARLGTGYDPDLHLLVEFEIAKEGRRAEGYSGAGVWFGSGPKPSRSIWMPDLLFAGVETQAYYKSGLLRVIRASVVEDFLNGLSF